MNFIQNIWTKEKANHFRTIKNIGILALVVLTIYLAFNKPTIPPLPHIDDGPILQQIKLLKDQNDKNSALLKQQTVDIVTAKRYGDSLAKALKLKPKQIKGVDVYYYKHDTIFLSSKPIIVLDSNKSDTLAKLHYDDNYISLSAIQFKNGKNSLQVGLIDTLTRTEVINHRGFLGLGGTYNTIIIRNTNPYVQMAQGSSYTTKQKKTVLVIGPTIGWNFLTNKPNLGFGLSVPLIRINR